MNAVLMRLVEGRPGPRKWLQEGQSLTVGRSYHADLCVDDDATLADIHFLVELRGIVCRLRALAGADGPVLVNGAPVVETQLRNQDVIRAGESSFRVVLEGGPSSSSTSPAQAANATLRVARRNLATGVAQFTIQQGRSHWGAIREVLGTGRTTLLAANFRRAGVTLPEGVSAEADRFVQAPAEIRATESFHLVPCAAPAGFDALLGTLWGRDAALVLFASVDEAQLVETHKIYWAWFARPSILAQQLVHGSTHLAERLLAGLDVVACESSGEGLILFVRNELADPLRAQLEAIPL